MSDEIIGFVVERIADLVAEEVNLLRGARSEFLRLQRELEMMQSFLIDADAKLEAGEERLRTAVKQIREMAYEAEDLIDSFMQKEATRKDNTTKNLLKRIACVCSCLVQTHQAGTEVDQLKKRIKETTERLQTYQVGTNVDVILKTRPKSNPYSIGDDNVVGFDNDVKTLVQQLINNQQINILAIAGMAGSGKTTLARKIYNHPQISRKFDCKAWICVSQVWNSESLLREILRQTTGRKAQDLTRDETVEMLHKLLEGKSYLLVLDDVWEQDALRHIMLPATSHRSKFLITTRIKEVVRFPDLGHSILRRETRRLTDEQSWELFKKIAFGQQINDAMVHDDDDLKVVVGKEMLKKCDGLPLAVISLAGLLSTKETNQEWERVRQNVISKISEDVGPSDYGRVEDMLALSYSDLNHTLKSCFLYLGLFPEDAYIPTGMLMRAWIAEGFFKSPSETIEDVARQCLNELIQRCLVQIARENYARDAKAIRIHDLMRDLAIKRAKEKRFLDTLPPTSSGTVAMQPRRLGVISSHLTFDADSFRHLEHLLLRRLENLAGFHVIEGAMPKLKRLYIFDCEKLKELPQGLRIITTLEELNIVHPGTELRSRLTEAETGSEGGGEDLHIIKNIPSMKIYD